MRLVGENDSIHVASPNSDHRRSTRLTLQSNQTKGLLDSRVNKQVGCAIDFGELQLIRAIAEPGQGSGRVLNLGHLIAVMAVSNHEQVKSPRRFSMEQIERLEKRFHVFLRREPADVK